jgi:hypothetical protein
MLGTGVVLNRINEVSGCRSLIMMMKEIPLQKGIVEKNIVVKPKHSAD